jgi:capsid assembly protease
MNDFGVFNQPWLINKRSHNALCLASRAAKVGSTQLMPEKPVEAHMHGDVAVIEVEGVLTKNPSYLTALLGGSSMRQLETCFTDAVRNPAVKGIILAIDSPGGTVDGTQSFCNAIYAARGKKPILAHSDGVMTSAAYWIGAAADKIYISGDTVTVGSIGVVATHVDVSEQDAKYGEKWTEITAGTFKRIASSHAPLTAEGRDYIQAQVDHIYSVFVESVAEFRNVKTEKILPAADGKIFIGMQAIRAGLVDGRANLQQLVESIVSPSKQPLKQYKMETFEDKVHAFSNSMTTGAAIMKTANLYPELHDDYLRRVKNNEDHKPLRRN